MLLLINSLCKLVRVINVHTQTINNLYTLMYNKLIIICNKTKSY